MRRDGAVAILGRAPLNSCCGQNLPMTLHACVGGSAAAVAPNTYAIQRVAGSALMLLPQRPFIRPFRCAWGLSFHRGSPIALASRARLLQANATPHAGLLACWCTASLRNAASLQNPPPPVMPAKRHLACRSSGEVVGGSSVLTWVSRIAFAVVAAVRGSGYGLTEGVSTTPNPCCEIHKRNYAQQATRHTCYCDLITHRESHRRYCYNTV